MNKARFFILACLPLLLGACSSSGDSSESLPASSPTVSSPSSSSTIPVELLDPIEEDVTETKPTGKCRAMYQIFPYSFCDSNGDDVGDIPGITSKLDYIQSQGYDGIWINPISPGTSYHKYDVEDYYDIDEQFGTLEDFDALISAAHERGMTILYDLVINHSSSSHQWFIEGAEAFAAGQTDNQYAKYYNFVDTSDGSSAPAGYSRYKSTSVYYEARFTSTMPDFNLQSVFDDPNCDLASELRDIFNFWLVDHDVDGFRLDAVTSYFTNDQASNLAFLTWLNDEVKALKPNAYIVGEGSWSANSSENLGYQDSGVDSFFNFLNASAAGDDGAIASAIQNENPSTYYSRNQLGIEAAGEGLPAFFMGNHDKSRITNIVSGRTKPEKVKFAHSLLQLLPGVTYNYYGDEIGMANGKSTNDPNKRTRFLWGDDASECADPPGTESYTYSMGYPYPSLSSQLEDDDSIVNFAKRATMVRRYFPEIANCESFMKAYQSGTVIVLSYEMDESTVYAAINFSSSSYVDLDRSVLEGAALKYEYSPLGETTADDSIMRLAPYGVLIAKSGVSAAS